MYSNFFCINKLLQAVALVGVMDNFPIEGFHHVYTKAFDSMALESMCCNYGIVLTHVSNYNP